MNQIRLLMVVSMLGCFAISCGGDDTPPVADVEGTYTIALTNRANECMFENWTEGDTATGVTIELNQSGGAVVGEVQGVATVFLDAALGSHVFTGATSERVIDMSIEGTRAGSMGACAYTMNADLHGTVDGDSITGTIEYSYATNNAEDCDYLDTCANVQAFNGARPPD